MVSHRKQENGASLAVPGRILLCAVILCSFGSLSSAQSTAQNKAATSTAQNESRARGEAERGEPEDIVRKRWEWFYSQRAYPMTRIPAAARARALRELGAMRRSERELLARRPASTSVPALDSPTAWTSIGPQPLDVSMFFIGGGGPAASGRVTALAVDPTNANVVYLGAAEGGVWKTNDGGSHWNPLTDAQASLAVGSIAIDPSNPSIIYVGTGEENFNGDAYYGEGILKSIDGGATWTHIAGPFAGPFEADSYYGGGARIGSLAVDPSNGIILLAGVLINNTGGIFRSSDGGATWTKVLPTGTATAVLFNPASGNTSYAALKGGGVYVSLDAGVTWNLQNGTGTNVIPTTSIGAIQLGIDRSNPATLYAAVTDSAGRSLRGLFKTTDGGANWSRLPLTGIQGADYCTPQCEYDSVVSVDPVNSSVVYAGGASGPDNVHTMYRSLDGGNTWTEVSQGADGLVNLHVDHHAIEFSADGSKLYVGNDGGAYSTSNVTTSPVNWTDLNQTLAITQFYPGISIDPTTASRTIGGTQDNGDVQYDGTGWTSLSSPCGDGGWTAIDPTHLNTVYTACIQSEGVAKSLDGGNNWASIETGLNTAERSNSFPPLVLDPSNPQTLYFGTFRVYQTTDGGSNWAAISPDLTTQSTANITTIAVAPGNANTVYVGTGDSHLQVTTNAGAGTGAAWNDMKTGLPPRAITQIVVDAVTSTRAYVTFSGFSGFGGDALGHVFKTTTGGALWTDISGNLPNIPINDIVIDPDLAGTLYVASDIGVFSTANGGSTWSTLMTGLPNVAILSLRLHEVSRTLRAASHGRSVWDLLVPTGIAFSVSPNNLSFPLTAVGITSAAQSVTVTNTGVTPLTFVSIVPTRDFVVASAGTTCSTSSRTAPGATCVIEVSFTPTASGARTGTLTLTAPGSPQTVVLTGTGLAPAVSLSLGSLTFAAQVVTTASAAKSVVLTNTGSAALNISSITVTGTNTGDFAVAATGTACNISSPVGPGGICTINITFAPPAAGAHVGTLTIADNAPGSPQTVALAGTGADFTLAAASGFRTTATVTAGGTAAYTLAFSGTPGFVGTVTLACSGAPTLSTCNVAPASLNLNGTTAVAAAVTVTTTARSIVVPRITLRPPAVGTHWLRLRGWTQRPAYTLFWWLALALILSVAGAAAAGSRNARWLHGRALLRLGFGMALLFAVTLATLSMPSCGGGGGTPPPTGNAGTPAGTYSLTVTGTSAAGSSNISRTLALSLTVQ